MQVKMKGNRTFLMCVFISGLTFWGGYINMFDAGVVEKILWACLLTYGGKSIGSKFALGYINKYNKEDSTSIE